MAAAGGGQPKRHSCKAQLYVRRRHEGRRADLRRDWYELQRRGYVYLFISLRDDCGQLNLDKSCPDRLVRIEGASRVPSRSQATHP